MAAREVSSGSKNTQIYELGKDKVLKADLLEYLETELFERSALLSLPVTFLFFFTFMMSVLEHEQIVDTSMLQRELRGMLTGTTFEGVQFTSGHKELGDIDVKEDVYNYVNEVVLALFLNPVTVQGRDTYRVLRYNQLVGGVQLQQVRRQKRICAEVHPSLGPKDEETGVNPILDKFACYPWNTESDDCFGKNRTAIADMTGWCPDAKSFASTRRLDFVPDGGGTGGSSKGYRQDLGPNQLYSVYFPEFEGREAAQEKLNILIENEWIDFSTSWVGINTLVYNPDLAIFSHTTVHVYFPPSGALLPHITATSFVPEPYQHMIVMFYDGAFLLMLVWIGIEVARHFVKDALNHNADQFFKNLWNWLDIACLAGGCFVCLSWVFEVNQIRVVTKIAMDVRMASPTTAYVAPDYPELVDKLHKEMATLADYLQQFRVVVAWYTILVAMRFLKAFSAQPRLAVVTNTLTSAAVDLFHFFIVLIMIFMSFACAGMFLFGRRVWEFASLGRAMVECCRIMLGDFDWGSLGDEHPITAKLWFLSYVLLMNFMMLNMLMAIIMDKYTEVKFDAGSANMIWEHTASMIQETVGRCVGRKMGMQKLHRIIKDILEEEIDGAVLVRACNSELSQEQALELIRRTRLRNDDKVNKGVTISTALHMVACVKLSLQKIGWKLGEIAKEEEEEHARALKLFEARPVDQPPPQSEGELFFNDMDGTFARLETQMCSLENFVMEMTQSSSVWSKDIRNRLVVIEDLIVSERDMAFLSAQDESLGGSPNGYPQGGMHPGGARNANGGLGHFAIEDGRQQPQMQPVRGVVTRQLPTSQ